MSVHIRPAELADARAIAEVQVEAWREAYAGILPPSVIDALSVERGALNWTRQLGEASTTVLLAETQERVIGFGARCPQRAGPLLLAGYDGEVSALYVLRAYHGQGHGARLLTGLFEDLNADGFDNACLWVLDANLKARGFYEKMGGVVIAEREDLRGGEILPETAYGWRKLKRFGPAEPLFRI